MATSWKSAVIHYVPKKASEDARQIRACLAGFATEAERIKGRIYGPEERAARWDKHLVISLGLEVIEMQEDGTALSITEVLLMADTTGVDAAETLKPDRHSCNN